MLAKIDVAKGGLYTVSTFYIIIFLLNFYLAAIPGMFDHIVVNDNLDSAFKSFEDILSKVHVHHWNISV